MENILILLKSSPLNSGNYWITFAIFIAASLLLGLITRYVFGQKSILNVSVSSTFGIMFIYGLTIILSVCGIQLTSINAPLPFVTVTDNTLLLMDIFNTHYTTLCSEILSMIILAFLVNIADTWLPKSKNIFSWLFFRVLTVIIGYFLHLLVVWLFTTYLPQDIVTYTPVILLAILVLMLVTGVLKLVIGALISTVNPIIGGLYTFFFANIIGKQITKAVLTTALFAGVITALRYIGIVSIAITSAALLAYLPIILIIVILWYVLCCIL